LRVVGIVGLEFAAQRRGAAERALRSFAAAEQNARPNNSPLWLLLQRSAQNSERLSRAAGIVPNDRVDKGDTHAARASLTAAPTRAAGPLDAWRS